MALPACATGSGTHYREGRPCRVELHQESLRSRSGGSLAVINEPWSSMRPSETPGGSGVSLVGEPALDALLGDFERLGFFDKAVRGNSLPSGDAFAVVLESGTWVLPKVAMREHWGTLVTGFNLVWNSGKSAVGEATTGPGMDFDSVKKRLDMENRKRMRELERRRRRP